MYAKCIHLYLCWFNLALFRRGIVTQLIMCDIFYPYFLLQENEVVL